MSPVGERPPEGARTRPNAEHTEEEVRGELVPEDDLLAALPGLIRIAAGAWWRTAEWTVGAYVRGGERLVRATLAGESPAVLANELRGFARGLLGLGDLEERLRSVVPDSMVPSPAAGSGAGGRNDATARDATLRDRGADLLRRSADVTHDEEIHPAYERILEALAPDEARILRLLATGGPQPAVDVRAGRPISIVSSELIAPGLQMIGSAAGARYMDRVPAYLNNLERLGLIWFSRESLEGPEKYQVLEAQPDVLAALHKGGRATSTVRRSIHLTPFGHDFCDACIPLDTAEFEALPPALPEPAAPADDREP